MHVFVLMLLLLGVASALELDPAFAEFHPVDNTHVHTSHRNKHGVISVKKELCTERCRLFVNGMRPNETEFLKLHAGKHDEALCVY